ncbi:nuclease [Iocasia frigidifontis]|uniref:Nuclease n=2 Tax=Iocasia fonsfrigidae TaxID=2682810 RepID=A0A8A7KPI2_9FIRM|nr:nuclease [Iocasia fonsfrigidae]
MIMKKKLLLIVFLIMICLGGLVLFAENDFESDSVGLQGLDRVFIDYVYDGDTVRTADGERIRLIGLDTPEMNWEEGEAEFYAREAFEYTKKKLLGHNVYLEYDQEKRDKYNRILAYLFLADGSFFNRKLLEEGYASLLLVPPNLKYAAELKEAADYLNKEVIVRGKVVKTYQSEKIIFLDFSKEGKDNLYLIIFKHNLNKFDYNPLELLLEKEIKVTGKVVEYKGRSEIIIDSPLQIFIL